MKKIFILIVMAFALVSCKDEYGLDFDAKQKKEKGHIPLIELTQKTLNDSILLIDEPEDKIDSFVGQLITGTSYGNLTSRFQVTRDGELVDGTARITFYIINDKQNNNSYLLVDKKSANIVIIQLDGE